MVGGLLWLAMSELTDAAPTAVDMGVPQLMVELRDGSRVVGQSVDGQMKFHSVLLGNLKLSIGDVRSVEFTATNAARLTAANGDVMAVQMAETQIPIRTSFGKVELAVESIRRLAVSATSTVGGKPPGLVALWSGEDNGNDVVNGNNAVWTDAAYTDGKVGRAFLANHFGSYGRVTANETLNVGKGDGLTVTAWIKPDDANAWHPLVEWNNGQGLVGVHLWLGELPGDRGVLFANIIDSQQQSHHMRSPVGAILPGRFQLIALTYDKQTGEGVIYVDGTPVCQSSLGQFTPETSVDLWFGHRPNDQPWDRSYHAFYSGVMDEISIYNRALSTAEIKSVSDQ